MANLLTEKQVFTRAARHLLKQNAKSRNPNSPILCAYRGKDGLKCAVGALIPDSLYVPEIEGMTARSRIVSDILEEVMVSEALPLCRELQRLHDRINPSDWRQELKLMVQK